MVGGPAGDQPHVEVRRSRRRRRTVSAYRDGDRTVVLIPARFTQAQEREWVERMLARLAGNERRRRLGDADLLVRAGKLSERYLGGLARPQSVVWVANQNTRWGSCTPAARSIRLSTRLQSMPTWVSDYVLLHELAHLIEPGHGPRFWELLAGYPLTDRARGFLEGYETARRAGEPVTGGPQEVLADDVESAEVEDEDEEMDGVQPGDLDGRRRPR